jgi:hypothetical protein
LTKVAKTQGNNIPRKTSASNSPTGCTHRALIT